MVETLGSYVRHSRTTMGEGAQKVLASSLQNQSDPGHPRAAMAQRYIHKNTGYCYSKKTIGKGKLNQNL